MSDLYTIKRRLMDKPMCEYCKCERWNCYNDKHKMKMKIIDNWFSIMSTNSSSKNFKSFLELDAVDEVYEKLTPIFNYYDFKTEDEIIAAIELSSINVWFKKSHADSKKSEELKTRILYQRVCDSIIRDYLKVVYNEIFKTKITNIHKPDIEHISS